MFRGGPFFPPHFRFRSRLIPSILVRVAHLKSYPEMMNFLSSLNFFSNNFCIFEFHPIFTIPMGSCSPAPFNLREKNSSHHYKNALVNDWLTSGNRLRHHASHRSYILLNRFPFLFIFLPNIIPVSFHFFLSEPNSYFLLFSSSPHPITPSLHPPTTAIDFLSH